MAIAISFAAGYPENSGRNLFAGNQIAYSSDPPDNVGASGMALTTANNIVRFNRFYHNDRAGLALGLTSTYYSDIVYNKVYSNTFFHNGINAQDPAGHMNSAIGFAIYSGTRIIKNNAFKNNLLYRHRNPFGTYKASLSDQIFEGNWDGDTQGDPGFVNASDLLGNPMDSSLPDLHLKSSSPCRDVGNILNNNHLRHWFRHNFHSCGCRLFHGWLGDSRGQRRRNSNFGDFTESTYYQSGL